MTVVPPRPGWPALPLAQLVEEACRDGEVKLSFAPEMLRCVRDYPQQKAAGGFTARRANVEGVFREGPHVPRGHVVIVDDIWTSGSTVMACARQLLSAGATFVTAVSLALDQSIVLSALEPMAIPCREPACDGTLSLRFNGQTQHGFWGCSEFFGARQCRGGLPCPFPTTRSQRTQQAGTNPRYPNRVVSLSQGLGLRPRCQGGSRFDSDNVGLGLA